MKICLDLEEGADLGWVVCTRCQGSGEGWHADQRCTRCDGGGMELVSEEEISND